MAAHFLSGGASNGQGRHYTIPVARDYSTLGYSSASTVPVSATTTYSCSPAQQLDRPGSVRNTTENGQPMLTTARIPSGSAENGSTNAVAGAMNNGNAMNNHSLLSPCSVMEEASSPGMANKVELKVHWATGKTLFI